MGKVAAFALLLSLAADAQTSVSRICSTVCCNTYATALPPSVLQNRTSVYIQNQSTSAIMLGGSTVTTSSLGLQVAGGGFYSSTDPQSVPEYCVATSQQQLGTGCTSICESTGSPPIVNTPATFPITITINN